jgi:hypothetical protein
MSSRIVSIFLLVAFAVFICTPGVAWVLGVKGGGTALQNRTLAKRPPFTFEKVWDASFGKELTDWVWDTIPLRDKALTMNHLLEFYVFKDSPSKDAFVGLDGWHWRRERVLQDIRAGGGDINEIKTALDRVEAAFDAVDIPVHIVLSPTKASMYPEFIPSGYREEFERIARPVEDYYRERAKTDAHIIDLWGPMHEEKQRLLVATDLPHPALRYLWRKNDDHWNVEAGRIQAREIVRAVDPSLWKEENAPILDGKFEEQQAELDRLYLKLGLTAAYQGLKDSPNVKVTWKKDKLEGSREQIATSTSSPTAKNKPREETVLVIRDSMLADHSGRPSCTRDGGFRTIAPFFEKSIFMHWETVQTARSKPKFKERMVGVDRVVVQVTQGSNYYIVKRAKELEDLAKIIRAANKVSGDAGDADVDDAPFIGPQPAPAEDVKPLGPALQPEAKTPRALPVRLNRDRKLKQP